MVMGAGGQQKRPGRGSPGRGVWNGFIGFTYLPPLAGSYRFDLTDIGGAVLATGTITVQ